MVNEQVKQIPNLKSLGSDRVTGLLTKKLTTLLERAVNQMDNIISN